MTSYQPRLDAERARAASLRTRYREIRAALEDLQVRAESTDRTVRVDMGVGGRVLHIELDDQALGLTPSALSTLLVETINEATRLMAERTNDAVRPLVGGAGLDLQAITTGRLPSERRPDWAEEIEQASAIPKRPLGRFTAPPPAGPAGSYTGDRTEDGDG